MASMPCAQFAASRARHSCHHHHRRSTPAIADAANEFDCELLLKPVKPAELRALMLHLLARAAQSAD